MMGKKKFKWLKEHPCRVCGKMIPEPMIYCSTKCREADKKKDIPVILEWDL